MFTEVIVNLFQTLKGGLIMAYFLTMADGTLILVKGVDAAARCKAPGVVKVEPVNLEEIRRNRK